MTPSDLFVVLDRAFRRRSRGCKACFFSLPYTVPSRGTWDVDAGETCSEFCRLVLEELVDEFRGAYRLMAGSRLRPH